MRRTRSRLHRGAPVEPRDEPAHRPDIRPDDGLADPRAAGSATGSGWTVGGSALKPRVQEHVGWIAASKSVARRHERAHLSDFDPVQGPAQPGPHIQALVRLEQQGEQVEHAELPVAHPELILTQTLEGADVDEHRSPLDELDVVWRGVLEHQVVLESQKGQVELKQRSLLEHREGPFIRIADDRDPLVLQHCGRLAVAEARHRAVLEQRGPNQPRVIQQSAHRQGHEIVKSAGAECTEYTQPLHEDTAVGIAEGPGVAMRADGVPFRGRRHCGRLARAPQRSGPARAGPGCAASPGCAARTASA